MDEYESLSHSKWECKYHVMFIPNCRRRTLYKPLRKDLGGVFRKLAAQKECRIEEGHLMSDHVYMLISIPPKFAVSQVVGYITGKRAVGRIWSVSAMLDLNAELVCAVTRLLVFATSWRITMREGFWGI